MNGMDGMAEMAEMAEILGGANGSGRIAMPLCDRTVNFEVSADLTLPDYLPDIRRVLSVRTDRMPPAKYVGGNKLEWNGMADYRILYVSADGGLYVAPLSGEYGFQAPMETAGREFDLNEGVCTFVSVGSDGLTTRVSTPRKLSLRHRMRAHVRGFGRMVLPDACPDGGDTVYRRTAEGNAMLPGCGLSDPIDFEDDCSLPTAECRLISAEPCVAISSVSAGDGVAEVSGEVILRFLLECDGQVQTMVRTIPFGGSIEGDGFRRDGWAAAEGVVSDLKVSTEDGRLSCSGSLMLSAKGMCAVPLRLTEDLYAADRESECEYLALRIPQALRCENRNLSQSERIPLSDAKLPEGAQILDAWGEATLERGEDKDGKALFAGQSRYFLLCQTDGDYSVAEVTLPLRYEADVVAPSFCDTSVTVISCRARVEGETLCIDGELSIAADYMAEAPMSCVCEVRMGQPVQSSANRMIVYYPVPGDTPWSVAKKYHVPVDSLKGDLSSYFVF